MSWVYEKRFKMNIIHTPSVNFSVRKESPSFIILHGISTPPKQSLEILTSPKLGVSSHYYIEQNGLIHELVSPDKKAFHAGISGWGDKKNSLNEYSIGIEFQCYKSKHHLFAGFRKKQIASGIELCHYLMKKYAIKPNHVLGHSDIAPDRKEDPGVLFPWSSFEEKGIGICPRKEKKVIDVNSRLKDIGYPVQYGIDACIIAFKRHFMPSVRIDAKITKAFLKKLSFY